MKSSVEIYTDGSCHTQYCIGAWAAVLFIGNEKVVLTGQEMNTTHNRMELTAVIKSIEYLGKTNFHLLDIKIYSDSQYVIGLAERREKLSAHNFETKAGAEIRNADLVKRLLELEASLYLQFIKVKAHQKKNDVVNYNIEVDKLSRKIVREAVVLYRAENN